MIIKTENSVPASGNKVSLDDDRMVIVSPEDQQLLDRWQWQPKKSNFHFYAVRKIYTSAGRRYLRLHRVITNCPPDMVVHHINGNTLDNRRENLQVMTTLENNQIRAGRGTKVKKDPQTNK